MSIHVQNDNSQNNLNKIFHDLFQKNVETDTNIKQKRASMIPLL